MIGWRARFDGTWGSQTEMPGPVPQATRNQGADLLRPIRNRAVVVGACAEPHQLPAVAVGASAFRVTSVSRPRVDPGGWLAGDRR